MQTTLSLSIVDPHKRGYPFWLFYGFLALCFVALLITGTMNLKITSLCIFLVAFAVVAWKRSGGHTFLTYGTLVLDPTTLNICLKRGTTQVYALQDISALHFQIKEVQGDGVTENGRGTLFSWFLMGSGIQNEIKISVAGQDHHYFFLLQPQNVTALNAILLSWIQQRYPLQVDDYTGRDLPYPYEEPNS